MNSACQRLADFLQPHGEIQFCMWRNLPKYTPRSQGFGCCIKHNLAELICQHGKSVTKLIFIHIITIFYMFSHQEQNIIYADFPTYHHDILYVSYQERNSMCDHFLAYLHNILYVFVSRTKYCIKYIKQNIIYDITQMRTSFHTPHDKILYVFASRAEISYIIDQSKTKIPQHISHSSWYCTLYRLHH